MTVGDFINQQTPEHGRILRWLRQLILTSDSDIREKIGWNVPVYTYRQTQLCYLTVLRSELVAVDLTFVRGTELPDEAGLLESRGRKTVKTLVVRGLTEPEEDLVRTYLQEALLLIEGRKNNL